MRCCEISQRPNRIAYIIIPNEIITSAYQNFEDAKYSNRMTRPEKIVLCALTFVFAFWWNRTFLHYVSMTRMMEMNDVPAIVHGYKQVPNLFDSGPWWRGTWIQEGISAYRPLASYLYWIESWLGLHWGFVWVGWLGVLLLATNGVLSGALAWRLTRWKSCVYVAAVLAVALRFFNWSGSTPAYWLAWYPIHQELLMNLLLLGAIVCLDVWNETAQRKYLLGAWACYVLGALTKEHVYIFPLFALAIALWHRDRARVSLKTSLLQCCLMAAAVLALWFYRADVLIKPRNPELKWVHIKKKPWLYLAFPLYPFVLTGQFWFPGLALLIFTLGGVLIKWRRSRFGEWLARPYIPIAVGMGVVAIICVYCALTYSVTETFWYLVEPANNYLRWQQLHILIALFYSFFLLWKYRKTHPAGIAFAFLGLSYLPVITYLGWHYTVPAWFVRSAYWALVAKLVWIDAAPLLKALVSTKAINKFVGVSHEPAH